MLQTDLTKSPIFLMVFNFSYSIGDAKTIYDYFKDNSTNYDSFIKMNKYLSVDDKNNFKVFEFYPDYRINMNDFDNILKSIKPGILYISDSDSEIKKMSSVYYENKQISYNFEKIYFQKAYYLSNNEREINDNLLNSNLSLNITKENERLFINSINVIPVLAHAL